MILNANLGVVLLYKSLINVQVKEFLTLVNLQLSKETVTPTTFQAPTAASTAVKLPSTPAVKYITLGSFSWEQDNDKVKVRMSIKL